MQRLQMLKKEEEAQRIENDQQEIDDDDLDWQEGEQNNERSYDEEEEWKRNMEMQ